MPGKSQWPFITPFEAARRGGGRAVVLLGFAHGAIALLILIATLLMFGDPA